MRALLLLFGGLIATHGASAQTPFERAVECIKRYEGLHTPDHHPYVGYGHRVMPGEKFPERMSERSADSLLRADLLRKCAVFRKFGRDSLLLGVLAYNIGEGKVLKSRLVEKLRRGERNVYQDYICFRLINGNVSRTLERRRKEEFELLFNNQ